MKKFTSFFAAGLAFCCVTTSSATPGWWSGIFGNTDDDLIVTIGQTKYVLFKAYQHLEQELTSVGGAGQEITNLIGAFPSNAPSDDAPITSGQIKYLARPFYDRLRSVGFPLDYSGHPLGYPWTLNETDDRPQAPVTAGQLRSLVDFNLLHGRFPAS